MPKPIKPPRGVFVATQVLFHPRMKSQVRDTLIQLLALAWGSDSRHTPPLSYPQLAALTGKTIGRLYGHLTILRKEHAALRLQPAGDGQMIICFADWLFPKQTPPKGFKNSKMPDEEEDVNSNVKIKKDLMTPPVNDHDINRLEKSRASDAQTPGSTALAEGLREELLSAGVFPSLLGEISRCGRSESDLRDLLAWCRADKPGSPAALFMGRLRAGAAPPEIYSQPPCPLCGVYGGHTEDCRRRYFDERYAGFIQGGGAS